MGAVVKWVSAIQFMHFISFCAIFLVFAWFLILLLHQHWWDFDITWSNMHLHIRKKLYFIYCDVLWQYLELWIFLGSQNNTLNCTILLILCRNYGIIVFRIVCFHFIVCISSGIWELFFNREVKVKNQVLSCDIIRWFSPHPLKSCWLLM